MRLQQLGSIPDIGSPFNTGRETSIHAPTPPPPWEAHSNAQFTNSHPAGRFQCHGLAFQLAILFWRSPRDLNSRFRFPNTTGEHVGAITSGAEKKKKINFSGIRNRGLLYKLNSAVRRKVQPLSRLPAEKILIPTRHRGSTKTVRFTANSQRHTRFYLRMDRAEGRYEPPNPIRSCVNFT